MGRCKQADHCGNSGWCKTTGKCLKAESLPHDAGSHDQPMTPAVQRAISEADRFAELRHERNVLQKIASRRAAALERVGLHADCTIEEAGAARAGLWWPLLTAPARVGNGTFNVGVSSRLVVEAAQRQHMYAEEEGRLTDEQARQHERNRRKLWDMLNGPLCNRMSCGEPCNLRPPCPDCGRACHDVPEGA